MTRSRRFTVRTVPVCVCAGPKHVTAGRDPQLERAVDEAMKLLKANPVKRLANELPRPEWGKRRGSGS